MTTGTATKPFWQSRTLWGGAMLTLAWAMQRFGWDFIPSAQEHVMEGIMAMFDEAAAIVGIVMVTIGRAKANKKLTA